MHRVLMVAVLCSGITVSAMASEITIGRWCDRPLPSMLSLDRVLSIQVKEDGTAVAHSRFGDGSEFDQPLAEVSGDVYQVENSRSGDLYRVVPSTGDLQIIDDDGLIGVARRLENEPRAGGMPTLKDGRRRGGPPSPPYPSPSRALVPSLGLFQTRLARLIHDGRSEWLADVA
jgi:hypothetical protein